LINIIVCWEGVGAISTLPVIFVPLCLFMLYMFLAGYEWQLRLSTQVSSVLNQGRNVYIFGSNGKQSTVNKSLDGSMYPGQKLAHSALGKKIFIVKNAIAYTWDWYCHLVVDRASL